MFCKRSIGLHNTSVLGPVDGVDVNALLYHFPERAHITQPLDGCHNFPDDKIYLSLGRETADTESER
jgi:hypothetical protein